MKKSEAYPTKYLSADDVDRPKVVTILRVSHEPMADGRLRPIVYVDGYQKGIVVNKGNAEALYLLAGTDDDADWPGVTFEVTTEPGRKPDGTPCEVVRFRVPPRKAKKAAKVDEAKLNGAEFDERNPPPRTAEELDEIPF